MGLAFEARSLSSISHINSNILLMSSNRDIAAARVSGVSAKCDDSCALAHAIHSFSVRLSSLVRVSGTCSRMSRPCVTSCAGGATWSKISSVTLCRSLRTGSWSRRISLKNRLSRFIVFLRWSSYRYLARHLASTVRLLSASHVCASHLVSCSRSSRGCSTHRPSAKISFTTGPPFLPGTLRTHGRSSSKGTSSICTSWVSSNLAMTHSGTSLM